MKYKAVVFDLFGTLVDNFEGARYEAFYQETAALLGLDGRRFSEVWRSDRIGSLRAAGQFETFEACLCEVCRVMDVAYDPALVPQVVELRTEMTRATMVPRRDTVATLQAIQSMGLKIGLLSDCSWEVPQVWLETPMAPLVDEAVFSCKAKMKKPDLRLYEKVCEALAVQPDECLYVGDCGSDELAGARRAGMDAALICVPYERHLVMGRSAGLEGAAGVQCARRAGTGQRWCQGGRRMNRHGWSIRPWSCGERGPIRVSQEKLELLEPAEWMRQEYLAYIQDFREAGEPNHGDRRERVITDFESFVEQCRSHAAGRSLPDKRVPETEYWLFRDGKMVASCRLRHHLNETLKQHGGHIGYDVRPSERGKRYAGRMLAMVLEEARQMGLHRVMLTCDKDNVASARTIVKNGGRLDREYWWDEDGKQILAQNYWIEAYNRIRWCCDSRGP